MTEELTKKSNEYFASAALMGAPVENAGITRSDVDGLEFSTAREKLPENMSREEYHESRPGHKTRIFFEQAGITRKQKQKRTLLIVGAVAVVGVGLTLLMVMS